MSTTLDDLLGIDGVTVAFEYTSDGKCTGYKANAEVSPEMAAMIVRYCALVTMTFGVLASAFTALSEANWIPQHGWMYTGGDYTVILGKGGYQGVFVETAKANWEELLLLMSDPSVG
jgi:roadblock/LC7 domain-containing protein